MEKKEFLSKLKATLDGPIAQNKAMASRIEALEHSVNEVIIGGLVDAANQYEDDENFSIFTDTYGEQLNPYSEHCKVLYGDDYDIIEEMYSGSKDKEDIAAYVAEEVEKLQSKLDALKSIKSKDEVEDNTVESKEGDEEVIDNEELMAIAKNLL